MYTLSTQGIHFTFPCHQNYKWVEGNNSSVLAQQTGFRTVYIIMLAYVCLSVLLHSQLLKLSV